MRKTEKGKSHVQLFINGIDGDSTPEIAGQREGFYRDAENMALRSKSGNDYGLERINGTDELYVDEDKSFKSMAKAEVCGNIVEILVHIQDKEVCIKVNGVVCLQDIGNTIGLSSKRGIQLHSSDSCKGGEIYFTDFHVPPFIFSIQDLIDNVNTPKYFSGFNQSLYNTILKQSLNIPVFERLVDVGGIAGVIAGQYAYSFRYVDKSGNRTLFTPPTPLIAVPEEQDMGSHIYNTSGSYGGLNTNTKYGVKIKFRVNNSFNYSHIEIRRIRWIDDEAIGVVPIAEVHEMGKDLEDGEVSVWEFIDRDNIMWEPLTDEEETAQYLSIIAAKGIRYFNGHLVLANVKYASKDLEGQVTIKELNNKRLFPFIDKLGEEGYSDPHNVAYKRSYMGGEKYSYGLACYDSAGNVAFVLPMADNYQMPDRRDTLSPETMTYSVDRWKGAVKACDVDNNEDRYVHEKFSKIGFKKTKGGISKGLWKDYTYFHPTSKSDPLNDHDTIINPKVTTRFDVGHSIPPAPPMIKETKTYNPDFGMDYYALGLMFPGIEDLPEWVVGFSIVRTVAAGRVVGQGIATYRMKDTPQAKGNLTLNPYDVGDKEQNEVVFYSDDILQGLGEIDSKLKLQLVSPLGFFSECYHGFSDVTGWAGDGKFYDHNVDMVVYVRELYTDPSSQASPDLKKSGAGNAPYWTKFGQWRDTKPLMNGKSNHVFPIVTVGQENFKGVGRTPEYNVLTLGANASGRSIYMQTTPQPLSNSSIMNVNNASNQEWHEPFYVANVINDGAEVADNNINDYLFVGHYQKIKSLVGKGDGNPINIQLVDERWEDCIPNPYYEPENENVFVYVDNGFGELGWLNVAFKEESELNSIITSLETLGYYDAPIPNGVKRIYGVYDVSRSRRGQPIVNDKGMSVLVFRKFGGLSNIYCIPQEGALIYVKYDSRFPLRVYGGDTVVGESVFALTDGRSDNDGKVHDNSQLYLWTGMPYPGYHMGYNILDTQFNEEFHFTPHVAMGIIRQMLVMFTSESRVNLPYATQYIGTGVGCSSVANRRANFPRIHYIMRPNKWVDDCQKNFISGGGLVRDDYLTLYPGEFSQWTWGGFRVIQQINKAYSQSNWYDKMLSKPKVGFEEELDFCTRCAVSEKRNVNEQNDPNLKTFIATNVFDISDRSGGITFLYDNDSDKGNNLIAFTEKGVCLLLTDKRIISQLDGNELMAVPADKLIAGEHWLSKEIGCPDEYWRGIAEYNNMIFFPNKESIYRMKGLEIIDIGKNNKGSYYSRILEELRTIDKGFSTTMCAVYNENDDEYWLHIGKLKKEIIFNKRQTSALLGVNTVLNIVISNHIAKKDGYYSIHENYDSSATGGILLLPSMSFQRIYVEVNFGTLRVRRFNFEAPFVVYKRGDIVEFYVENEHWESKKLDDTEILQLQKGVTLVYNNAPQKQFWVGTFDYHAQNMLFVRDGDGITGKVVLMLENNTHVVDKYGSESLGKGIYGGDIIGKVKFIVSNEGYITKEFIAQMINSSLKPAEMGYSDSHEKLKEAIQTVFRDYGHTFYTQIPRRNILLKDNRRLQGRYLVCELTVVQQGELIISSVETIYKEIV